MTAIMSCALAPSLDTPDHVALAEELGFERAWLYDSPSVYADIWMMLALAAKQTKTIGLGTGVLIPSLRHPMVNATAVATLAELADPKRLAIGFGAGFSGRFAMGQKPLRWSYVQEYVRAFRGLLRGEIVEWEGKKMQMLHSPGFGATRPLNIPVIVGAEGPKGKAVAREEADGWFIGTTHAPDPSFSWEPCLTFGTVMDDDEDATSPRVMDAIGFGSSVRYHVFLENGLDMSLLPNGEEWKKTFDDIPEDERHLAVHDRHLIEVNDRDRPFLTPEFLQTTSDLHRYPAGTLDSTRSGHHSTGMAMLLRPEELREQAAEVHAAGVTEIVYQPGGPDVPRELRAWAAAYLG